MDVPRPQEPILTASRFTMIIFIFAAAGIAWLILGHSLEYRTATLDRSLEEEVNARWGPSGLIQPAPVILAAGADSSKAAESADPAGSTITVDFEHEDRYMGLIWFSVYTVRFSGEYLIPAADSRQPAGVLQFRLPPNVRSFEDLALKLDGQPCDGTSSDSGDRVLRVHIPSDGQKHVIAVSYLARGRDRWEYATAPEGSPYIPLIRNFTMTATANFSDIDYPKGSVSPVKRATVTAGNASAAWQYNNLRANQRMGLEMPMRQNAGPVAARMSYFAPVSLFFFFTVLFTIVLLKQINLHPMHYLFIAAGFFAFHILLAYLVDLVDLEVAFWICAAVSVVLVVSYMRLVGGVRFAVLYVGLAQLVYLIGFSYAFLWKGHTGLTVVIGAIVTLFVLMQSTGRINWSEVFGGRRPTGQFVAPPPPVPPQP